MAEQEGGSQGAGRSTAKSADVPTAGGAAPLPGESTAGADEAPQVRFDPGALREVVGGVAAARSGDLDRAAALALRHLAAAVEALAGSAATADEVRAVQRHADALDELAPVSLERSDRIHAALGRAVEAMRTVAGGLGDRRRSRLQPWIDSAADAVDAIEPSVPAGLHRGVLQDALRAVADAVLVAHDVSSE